MCEVTGSSRSYVITDIAQKELIKPFYTFTDCVCSLLFDIGPRRTHSPVRYKCISMAAVVPCYNNIYICISMAAVVPCYDNIYICISMAAVVPCYNNIYICISMAAVVPCYNTRFVSMQELSTQSLYLSGRASDCYVRIRLVI